MDFGQSAPSCDGTPLQMGAFTLFTFLTDNVQYIDNR